MIDKKKQGKSNRKKGKDFELKTRKYLEMKGWIVDKFSSNIDLEKNCFKPASIKYIQGRGMMPGLGFPDFTIFKRYSVNKETYRLYFVECKINNILTKLEKQKLQWLVDHDHRCFVAYNNDGEIATREFLEYKEQKKVC